MKMSQDDYDELESAINQTIKAYSNIKQSYLRRGLSMERFRWDMLHLSGFSTNPLYAYLHDSHIDTALRKITNTT